MDTDAREKGPNECSNSELQADLGQQQAGPPGQLVTLPDGRAGWTDRGGAIHDASGRIIASPRPFIASSQQAAALARQRWDAVEAAKWAGLADAALELGYDAVPADAVRAIVRARAKLAATAADRAGNEAARLVLQLVGLLAVAGAQVQTPGPDGPDSVTVSIQGQLARDVMQAIAQARQRQRTVRSLASPASGREGQQEADGPAAAPAAAAPAAASPEDAAPSQPTPGT